MKVAIVGAGGLFIRPAIPFISEFPEVDELVLVGRTRSKLEAVAQELGVDARVVEADVYDHQGLLKAISGAGLVINATGPYFRTLLPVLNAAVEAGAHYCDYSAESSAIQEARNLDDEMKARGLTALLAFGEGPGLSSLMAMYGAQQLDSPQSIVMGWVSEVEATVGDVPEKLQEIRESGRGGAGLLTMFKGFTGNVPMWRGGKLVTVRSIETPLELVTPDGDKLTAFPFGTSEPLTLPRVIPGVSDIAPVAGFIPLQVNELIGELCQKIESGELEFDSAALEFFEELDRDRSRWLGDAEQTGFFANGVVVDGIVDGQPARWTGALRWNLDTIENAVGLSTSGVAALAAKKLMEGEITQRGAVMVEDCFEPIPYLRELAKRFALFEDDERGPIASQLRVGKEVDRG
jgi:saccharopine dehydrogenase (NAD+, L-lysine-forming)